MRMRLARPVDLVLIVVVCAIATARPATAQSTVTVDIVSISGDQSFARNPVSVSAGGSLVWSNRDLFVHRIVLDDGSLDTGNIVPGASSAPLGVTTNGGAYHCTIHPGMVGTVTVATTPTVTGQPANRTVVVGGTARFTASVTGAPTPAMQWQVSSNGGTSWTNLADGSPYSGATTTALTVTGVPAGFSGFRYRLVATNSAGSATSNAAALTVVTFGHGPVGDFDGDTKVDITVYSPSSGVWLSSGRAPISRRPRRMRGGRARTFPCPATTTGISHLISRCSGPRQASGTS